MLKPLLFAVLLVSPFARAGEDSVGEPFVIWDKQKIHVCWQNSEDALANFTENEKTVVRNIVKKEYRLERVGISFFGWEDCTDLDPKSIDVRIRQDSDESNAKKTEIFGSSSIGKSGKFGNRTRLAPDGKWVNERGLFEKAGYAPSMYLKVERNQKRIFVNYLDNIEFVALHEFGHLAGLRHEHIRKEATSDPNCFLRRNTVEKPHSSSKFFSPYDPNSIMNYCWMDMITRNGTTWRQSQQQATAQSMGLPFLVPYPAKNLVGEFSSLPRLMDDSLYDVTYDLQKRTYSYHITIGLSRNDVKALRCLYVDPHAVDCQ